MKKDPKWLQLLKEQTISLSNDELIAFCSSTAIDYGCDNWGGREELHYQVAWAELRKRLAACGFLPQ